jgi:hypothetical protein
MAISDPDYSVFSRSFLFRAFFQVISMDSRKCPRSFCDKNLFSILILYTLSMSFNFGHSEKLAIKLENTRVSGR